MVCNIQRYSVHDGTGLRDLVFMKGCPLSCQWCSNPECINYYPEILYLENKCIGYSECGKCRNICPVNAISTKKNGKITIDRQVCNKCGKCAQICPSNALTIVGEPTSVDELVEAVEEDSAFYLRSGGGITVGGGEPLFQPDFVSSLLKRCMEHGIDRAIETSGYASWKNVEKVCKYVNLIFYDIKHMNSDRHKSLTGRTNKIILENIKRLSKRFPEKPIVARTPLIPGLNDSRENIEATAIFLGQITSLREYELLSYHGFGEQKYYRLGKNYALTGLKSPSREHMLELKAIVEKHGINCVVS